MIRKKNKMFVDSADRTPHYSLRKLSVGVASVLLSTTLWMGANGSVAHADTINDATATVAGKASRSADTENKQAQEGDSANAEAQTTTANDAQADVAKQEPAAPSQQTAPQAQVSAPKTSAANKKMVMASLAGTASAGGKNTAYDNQNQAIVEGKDQISFKNGELSSLANRAKQDGLTVNKEDDKTYADKQEALADLDK